MLPLLTPVYCFYIYFLTTTKDGVYPTVNVGRGNKDTDFMIRHVCPVWPSFDAVELHIRGLEYDSRRLSVTNFILDISVAQNERLCTEY
jgi:hypothetical protein